jgi:hypothetical protein
MSVSSKIALSVASLTLFSAAAFADIQVAVGPKIGTLGLGLEALVASEEMADVLNLRLGVNAFRYSREIHKDSVKWNGKLNLRTLGAFLDYHPFCNSFRLSAGPVLNDNNLNLSVTPSQNITINGRTYTPAQVGQAKGKLKFNKVSPYLGVGYEGAFINESALSFNMEAGVLFQGKAKGNFSANGTLANAQLLTDLQSNAEKAANKGLIRYYPVVSLGFKYRF